MKISSFTKSFFIKSFGFVFFLVAFFCAAFFCVSAQAVSNLDIGADYRIRAVQISNPNYASDNPGSGATGEQKYYSHRSKIYMKARFDPSIEIATVLQAIGVSGSTGPILGRYPNENFTPFVENAYIRAGQINDWPISLTVGRQPYTWGNGLLLSDDGLGFDGINLEIGPYWGGIRNYFFTAKAHDKITTNDDSDIYLAGTSFSWGIHNLKIGYLMERDRSGTAYSSLDTYNGQFKKSSVATSETTRQFYDVQVGGVLEKGAFYSAEYAMQSGTIKIPGRTDGDVTLSGSAITFEGGFDFYHPRYKRMVLAFVFMQGSGDEASTRNEDESFKPSWGHKYDGLEPSGRGEFFAATPYSFYNQDKIKIVTKNSDGSVANTYDYNQLFSGLRTFGFRGSVNPWEPFTAGLEFYIHTARETPDLRNGAPTTIADNELGRELIISTSYLYAKRINFVLRWGKTFPSANLNNVGSSRLTLEASAKF